MKIEIDDNSLKSLAKAMEEFVKKYTKNTEDELFYGVVKSKYTEKQELQRLRSLRFSLMVTISTHRVMLV